MLPFTPSSVCNNHTGLCLIVSLFITFLCQAGWWRIHSFLQVFAQICLPTTTWTSWFKAVAASLLPIHLPPGLQSLLFSTFLHSTSPFNKCHDVLTYHIVFSISLPRVDEMLHKQELRFVQVWVLGAEKSIQLTAHWLLLGKWRHLLQPHLGALPHSVSWRLNSHRRGSSGARRWEALRPRHPRQCPWRHSKLGKLSFDLFFSLRFVWWD